MNPNVAVLLFLGALIGVGWLISVTVESGFKVAEDAVGRSRGHLAREERRLATEFPIDRSLGTLGAALTPRGWICSYEDESLVAVAPSGYVVRVATLRRGSQSILRIRTQGNEQELDSLTGEVLAALRTVDPAAHICPVGS